MLFRSRQCDDGHPPNGMAILDRGAFRTHSSSSMYSPSNNADLPSHSWTVTSPHTTACARRASRHPAGQSCSARSRSALTSCRVVRTPPASSCMSSQSSSSHVIQEFTVRRAVGARSSRWRCSPWAPRTTSRWRTR